MTDANTPADFERRGQSVQHWLQDRFACDPVVMDQLDDDVLILGWEKDGLVTAATFGLWHRQLPECVEYLCEVDAVAAGAAPIALRVCVERVLATQQALVARDLWINDQPFLKGSRMWGLLVADDPDEQTAIRDSAGQIVGHARRILMLTRNEALAAGEHGTSILSANDPAYRDPDHADLVDLQLVPVPQVEVIASEYLADNPVQLVLRRADGEYLALSGVEQPGDSSRPEHFGLVPAADLVERNPGIRDFMLNGAAGEAVSLREGGWVIEPIDSLFSEDVD